MALAFIPGVSTVAGIIKAVNYSKREFGNDRNKKAWEIVNERALRTLKGDQAGIEKKLKIISIIEMCFSITLPGIHSYLYLYGLIWSPPIKRFGDVQVKLPPPAMAATCMTRLTTCTITV